MRPLDVAVLRYNFEITHLVLEQNARPCKAGMNTAAAARIGFLDLLQHFMAMGDDINLKGNKGEILLHATRESG
jgi:hypothetical protein